MRVHRVGTDAARGAQLGTDVAREPEVGGVIAVEVADLVTIDLEPELSAAAEAGLDARPGGDLRGDPLSGCFWPGHRLLLARNSDRPSSYKFK
jgi:hypothetical protein